MLGAEHEHDPISVEVDPLRLGDDSAVKEFLVFADLVQQRFLETSSGGG